MLPDPWLVKCLSPKCHSCSACLTPPRPPSTPPRPPPNLPPPNLPPIDRAKAALDEINNRFVGGQVTNDLSLAGVLVHQTDWMDGGWSNGDNGQAWRVSPSLSDRFAGSLISAQRPHMYSTSAVGFVLNSADVKASSILCAYPRDGGSMNKGSHGCGGGVNFRGYDFLVKMMLNQDQHVHYNKLCLWGEPNDEDRSGCQYNELVLDGAKYSQSLPHVIQAVFYPFNGPMHVREGDAGDAQRLHVNFLANYRLSQEDVPLLAYDVGAARKGLPPFALAYQPELER